MKVELQTCLPQKSCLLVPLGHKKNLGALAQCLGAAPGAQSFKILVIKVKISKILILMKLKI